MVSSETSCCLSDGTFFLMIFLFFIKYLLEKDFFFVVITAVDISYSNYLFFYFSFSLDFCDTDFYFISKKKGNGKMFNG